MNLHDLDLNLLKVFDTLYKEQSLTRVARSMHLSQPAISHSLAKLRVFFNDPLFVREGHLMVPTKRAQTLNEDINTSLTMIRKTLEDKGHTDPRQSSRTFVLGLTNYCSVMVLPELLQTLEKEAHQIQVITRHSTLEQKETSLEEGGLDLVIGCSQIKKSGFMQQKLFSDKEVCIAGKHTKIPEKEINLENIGRYPVIRLQVSQHETTGIFPTLDSQKIKLNNTFTTDQEFVIPDIVTKTNHIGIVAKKIALKYQQTFNFNIYPIQGIDTRFTIQQYWHMRADNDPVHTWFRQVVKKISTRFHEGEYQIL